MKIPARILLLMTIALALLCVPGCFESPFPVSPHQGDVELDFVGNWVLESRDDEGKVQQTRLVIRNLHNREYYVEWQSGDKEPFRCTGWLTDVNGALFASLLPLTDDGEIAEKYTILRVVPDDAKRFEMRNLDHRFFENHTIDSSEALRDLLEKNLDNEEMYDGHPMIATREER